VFAAAAINDRGVDQFSLQLLSAPLAAIGVYRLQMRLERRDYDRHADD
jgi:hypothetical protein